MKLIANGSAFVAMAMLVACQTSGPAQGADCGFAATAYTVIDEDEDVVGSVQTVNRSSGLHVEGRVAGGAVKYALVECKGERHAEMRKVSGSSDAPSRFTLFDAAGVVVMEFDEGDESRVLTLRP